MPAVAAPVMTAVRTADRAVTRSERRLAASLRTRDPRGLEVVHAEYGPVVFGYLLQRLLLNRVITAPVLVIASVARHANTGRMTAVGAAVAGRPRAARTRTMKAAAATLMTMAPAESPVAREPLAL